MAKETPDYKWFRCVTPSWDNWARRHEGASVFLDSTPEKYQAWLAHAVDHTNGHQFGEERIVFVNAWNEWAEGNHLEPDQKFGHGYLEATKKALEEGQLASNIRRISSKDDMKVTKLMNQLAAQKYQLKEIEEKMQDLLETTSWRVTAPLRRAKQLWLDLKMFFSR